MGLSLEGTRHVNTSQLRCSVLTGVHNEKKKWPILRTGPGKSFGLNSRGALALPVKIPESTAEQRFRKVIPTSSEELIKLVNPEAPGFYRLVNLKQIE